MKEKPKFGYGYYFRRINQSLKHTIDDLLLEMDLTKSQEDILRFLHLHENESIIQKDIENFYHISNPTVTGLLNRLESKGFIVREFSNEDKRVRTIKITSKAKAVQEQIIHSITDFEAALVKDFSKEEKKMFFEFLERVNNNLEQEEKNDKNISGSSERV